MKRTNYYKCLDLLISEVRNITIEEDKTFADKEFPKYLKNHLFNLSGPKRTKKTLNNKEKFVSEIFFNFSEIFHSFQKLKNIEIYINRFPYDKRKIQPPEYLKYHFENFLNEIYLFEERVKKFITIVSRRYKKRILLDIKKIVTIALKNITRVRGAHVHKYRYDDEDFSRLETLELLCSKGGMKSELGTWYKLELNRIKKGKRKIIKDNNKKLDLLLDTIFNSLNKILFQQDKLVFP